MNILLVAIDTLGARHMGCYGYERNTTPFLDAYARDGVLFESLYCQAIPTHPSFTSVYTGEYAITHGIVSHGGTRSLGKTGPFLPEVLQSNGYTTCAVDTLGLQKDWLRTGYEFYISPRQRTRYTQAITCEEYNARAIPWLRHHADEKFFLFVHYWDPHTPYFPPKRYRNLFYDGDPCDPQNRSLEEFWRRPIGEYGKTWLNELMPGITDAEFVAAMYDSEIRHVDDGVADLLAALEDLGMADETLVIIFSDHGEVMYKHGIYFDHHGLYDDDLHVPLIVHWPEANRKGARIPDLVQHVDIAPTILDAVRIPIPQAMEGTSLVPFLNGMTVKPVYPFLVTEECTRMMKWGLRTDRYKYILAREQDYLGGPMRELYDLAADPHELENIAEVCLDTAGELEDVLEGWIAKMMQKNGLTEDPLVANGLTLGAKWFEWVREHGYW